MSNHIWVVERQFRNGEWDVAEMGDTGFSFSSRNYYEAHVMKRRIQAHSQELYSKYWTKKRFRVVRYEKVMT